MFVEWSPASAIHRAPPVFPSALYLRNVPRLQGWCIRGQRCVVCWNRGDVTWSHMPDLGPVTFDPELPFLPCISRSWTNADFGLVFAGMMYGQRCVTWWNHGNVTVDPEIPFPAVSLERLQILVFAGIWCINPFSVWPPGPGIFFPPPILRDCRVPAVTSTC
jgi:hypothetical protein